jgi:hypothetical protein
MKMSGDDGDEGEEVMMVPKGGTKRNTTASAWRRLHESDMSQYMASGSESDSDDAQAGGCGDEESGKGKKERAAQLRKLLLGGGDDEEGSEDDFFMHSEDEGEGEGEPAVSEDSSGEEEGGDTDKVMSFMPTKSESDEEGGGKKKKKSRKQKKAEREANREDWEVPQETLKRMREEKRIENKKAKRSRKDVAVAADEASGEKNTDLELLFAGDESEDEGRDRLNFTKKQLAAAEDLKQSAQSETSSKKRRRMSKSKAKLLAETETDSFELDMNDSRFSKVLEGDADYGIDRLSNEYRPTQAMEKILNERNNRKIAADKQKQGRDSSSAKKDTVDASATEEEAPVTSNKLSMLAKKLKKNFNK